MLPERYRIACLDQLGLTVRAVIVWSKPNGLPESVTDRVRRSHEDWVHLTKEPRYFAAVDEIREPQHPAPAAPRPPGGTVRADAPPLRLLARAPTTAG
jgi:DNA modification methylase